MREHGFLKQRHFDKIAELADHDDPLAVQCAFAAAVLLTLLLLLCMLYDAWFTLS